jgi:hypothetical protein
LPPSLTNADDVTKGRHATEPGLPRSDGQGGAQRRVWRVNEPKRTGVRGATNTS